jgi:Peptidase A4 family
VPIRVPLILSAVAALSAAPGAAAATTVARRSVSNLRVERTTIRRDTAVSSNWAGYAVTSSDLTAPTTFTRVSSRWVEPAAACDSGGRTYSAFWVGLGGFAQDSQALEQIGTEADCSAAGNARYAMWYELVPAASVPIKLKVFPGNAIAASVSVKGTKVTLQIRNLTRKTKFTKTLRMSAPDLSSAEWVAEAPSACNSFGRCDQLPLSNFGSIAFTRASATANGHTGAITDSAWGSTPIQLVPDPNATSIEFGGASTARAVPSTPSPDGTAFSVAWQAAPSQ